MGADGVRADHPDDLSRIGLGDAAPPAGDAGVVHEYVDVAERRQRVVDHGLIGVDVVDRRLIGRRLSAQALDLADGLARRFFVTPVVDSDVGAVGRQAEGDGLADAPAPSGDQRHPSFERHGRRQ